MEVGIAFGYARHRQCVGVFMLTVATYVHKFIPVHQTLSLSVDRKQ